MEAPLVRVYLTSLRYISRAKAPPCFSENPHAQLVYGPSGFHRWAGPITLAVTSQRPALDIAAVLSHSRKPPFLVAGSPFVWRPAQETKG